MAAHCAAGQEVRKELLLSKKPLGRVSAACWEMGLKNTTLIQKLQSWYNDCVEKIDSFYWVSQKMYPNSKHDFEQ